MDSSAEHHPTKSAPNHRDFAGTPAVLGARRLERRRIRWFFAGLLVAVGILDVFQTLLAHHPVRDQFLEGLIPTEVVLTGRTASVVAGLALLLLARGIARGKRVAWQVTIGVLAISSGLHLLKNLDIEEALIAIWVMLGLWWMRGHFQASSDSAALKRGLATIAAALALAFLYAFGGSWLLRHDLAQGFHVSQTLRHVTGSLVGAATPYRPLTERAQWFVSSMPTVAGALVLVGILQMLRPVVAAGGSRQASVDQARRLLERWGHNPISWLSLSEENHLWVQGSACVAYRLHGRVAITLGDPITSPGHAQESAQSFIDFCDRHDWICAFYEVERPDPYRALGYKLIPTGSDAIVPVEGFNLEGRRRADLRYAVRRCEREGVTFSFLPGAEAWELEAEELRSVSASWLRHGKGPEMGFSLGTLDSLESPGVQVALAHGPDGRLVAFASWLPTPRRRAWTLDLMRRRPDAPYGVMEALLVHSLEEARRRGLVEASLGVAPLLLEGPPRSRGLAALDFLYRHLGWIHGSRSLQLFKAKFSPRWDPRYLAIPDRAVLPEVLAALLGVHLPRPLQFLAGLRRAPPPRLRTAS